MQPFRSGRSSVRFGASVGVPGGRCNRARAQGAHPGSGTPGNSAVLRDPNERCLFGEGFY